MYVNTCVLEERKELRCKTKMHSIACKFESLKNIFVYMGHSWLWLVWL